LSFAIPKARRESGGFPGAARILANLADGPARLRVGLSIAGRQPAREGSAIFRHDTRVGTVSSGGFSPTLQAPIAMGFVDAAYASINTPLEIDVRGKRLDATVVPMPFVPNRYHRKGKAV